MCLANFCTANLYTTEAILKAGHDFGRAHGLKQVPVVVSATANYAVEAQLISYSVVQDSRAGMRALLDDMAALAGDGIVKVNVWTTFERVGGQAVARYVLRELAHMLPSEEVHALHAEGWIGPRVLDGIEAGPRRAWKACGKRAAGWSGRKRLSRGWYFSWSSTAMLAGVGSF